MAGERGRSKLADVVRRRIRELRGERGMTQAQVCERAGISIDAVTRIESGKREPALRTLELLASALDVAPSAFFDGAPAVPHPTPGAVRRLVALLESQSDEVLVLAEGVLAGLVQASRRNAAASKKAQPRSVKKRIRRSR